MISEKNKRRGRQKERRFMTYFQFVQAVEQQVKAGVKKDHEVHIHTARKNNGVWRKGLSISESGINVAPTIYLEEYYQQFQKGATVEKITEDILELYGELRFQKPWYPEELNVYQEVREKIVYRLIHRERNQELLEQVPYVPWLDLAIVFVVLLEAGDKGSASMMICRDQLARWGVTREEVYRQARENTWRLLPVDFRSMGEVMEDALFLPSLDEILKLYVLTNRWKNYGAAAALYEGQLQAVGEMFGENFYVIPSSVHEMLILPESRVPKREELDEMIKEINEIAVAPEEVLGDRAYYYDRDKGELC